MPAAEPNKAIRFIVPFVVISLATLFVALMFVKDPSVSTRTPDAADATNPALVAPTGLDAVVEIADSSPVEQPAEPSAPSAAVPAGDSSLSGLAVRRVELTAEVPSFLGELDDPTTEDRDTDYEIQLEFTFNGAGISEILASHHYNTIEDKEHYVVQKRAATTPVYNEDGTLKVPSVAIVSLATRAVEINGTAIDLFSSPAGESNWQELAPGRFVAEIVNDENETVARIEKTYRLTENSYEIEVDQKLINLTAEPMRIRWYQYGPVDLSQDLSGYRIDTRRIRKGHLYDARRDPSRILVDGYQDLTSLNSVRKKINKSIAETGDSPLVWQGAAAEETGPLVWIAQTGRYFAFAVHPRVTPDAAPIADKAFHLAGVVRALRFYSGKDERVILQLESDEFTIEGGGEFDASFGAYAGPMGKRELVTGKTKHGTPDPFLGIYEDLRLDGLIVYNLGGMCAMCTFQPLARLLLRFLMFAHDHVTFDWALSIMLLVLVVRTILHPLYKKSQISLQTFTKQMQRIAPKQKKLQEKYKDEPKKLQGEMARLMREENVKFTGALGCLPMFMQSPIWIALYAMLYFLFDLRHEAAFFGVFQQISGGAWVFLADLSSPDRFIDFGHTIVTIPLMGDIRSINVLPLMLGVVFFVHQKYISPPPSATMTDEQKSQQKIMKIIMVVMFPVFMYNAPSGLAIYFITNSGLGIIEGRWIRAHIDQLDLDNKVEKLATEGRKRVPNKAKQKSPFTKNKGAGEGSKYKKRK